ncbi:MAG TPA: hypothetical protein VKE24_01160 [Candidatus Acidoferrales bacterium]|nr:hypothetical protein [Candidatus Acidoferrales bacterium]
MGLLDATSEEPQSKLRRWIISGLALALLISLTIGYMFRFYPEKRAVERFLDTLVAGDTARAYQLWKPSGSYTFQDFLEDWGPTGYYGPVKSYHIETAQNPRGGGSGVIIVVELSPYQPFPAANDTEKNRRTKEVRIWVERKDKSLGFPP